MRRLASLLALVGVLAAAGCGSDSGAGPLDEGLSYLPKNAPFAVAIDTDTEGGQFKSLEQVLDKFPFGGQLKQSLERQLESNSRISFNRDLKPILGNPFVVGAVNAKDVTDGREDDQYVGAIKARDKGKLDALVKKQGAKEDGEKSGAKIYKARDGGSFAIKEDVMVVSGTRKLLESALERRDGDDHMDQEAFDKGLEGLPEGALVRVYADVAGLLRSDPEAGDARRIKWVDSLTTLGLTAQSRDDALAVDFKLSTKPGLSERDLPVAAGEAAPGVVERAGEIGIGLRDPSRLIKFAEAAGQAVNPADYGQYTAAKKQIEKRYGVSLDGDVIGQLTGDTATTVSVDGKFATRAEVKDPAAMKQTLKKLAPALPELVSATGPGGAALVKPKRGEDLYALAVPKGESVVFGVVGKALVVANDASRASQVAAEPPTTVGEAKGAFVVKADAEQVANRVLGRLGPQLGLGGALGGRLFTSPLGALNGSLMSTTSGMTGKLVLDVD